MWSLQVYWTLGRRSYFSNAQDVGTRWSRKAEHGRSLSRSPGLGWCRLWATSGGNSAPTSHTDTASQEWGPTHFSSSLAPSQGRLPRGQQPERRSARPETALTTQCALVVLGYFHPVLLPLLGGWWWGGHRGSARHRLRIVGRVSETAS